jgi:2-methylcitrate dehydratase PrpD
MLGGEPKHLTNAIGIAASSTLGQREALGTSSGTLHAGKAASNGAIAAWLAIQGFTGDRPLDHPDGFFRIFPPPDPKRVDAVAGDLGERWLLLENAIKPYPCSVLGHAAIDGTLALRDAFAGKGPIEEIRITSHPKVAEFSGIVDPRNELEAAYSTPHAVAAAAIDGEFGVAQITALRLADSDIVNLRDSVLFLADEGCALDEATVEVEMQSGELLRHHIAHAKGSAAQPVGDEELFAKVRALVEPVIPGASQRLRAAVEGLHDAPSAASFLDAATARPTGVTA